MDAMVLHKIEKKTTNIIFFKDDRVISFYLSKCIWYSSDAGADSGLYWPRSLAQLATPIIKGSSFSVESFSFENKNIF